MKLSLTRAFERDLLRLSQQDREATIKSLELFIVKPESRGLNFEHVRARKSYCTIRATRGVRILLRQVGGKDFEVVGVGSHDYIYDRK